MSGRTVLLLDGYNLFYRSYHASLHQDSKYNYLEDGSAIGGIRLLGTKLVQLLSGRARGINTRHAIMCLEGGDNIRRLIYPEYKGNRSDGDPTTADLEARDQISRIEPLCKSMGIAIASSPGYEADDVMATLARMLLERGDVPIVVSTDKDMACLVERGIRVYHPYRPADQDGFVTASSNDYLVLMGDAIDNIPSIPTFGKVSAIEATRRGLHSARRLRGKMTKRNVLAMVNGMNQVEVNLALVRLHDDCPLDLDLANLPQAMRDEKAIRTFAEANGMIALSKSKGIGGNNLPSKGMFG